MIGVLFHGMMISVDFFLLVIIVKKLDRTIAYQRSLGKLRNTTPIMR